MYQKYVFNENNQNHITALIQEAADFLLQIGLNYAGWVLAGIGHGLFAVSQILLIF
ncbi:MAG: hypothetical protein M3P08_04300 [Thermoproteota archaeon]|jgi:hypothetical protein|nr:hypothetical protein [Thermoproteota archaeon]